MRTKILITSRSFGKVDNEPLRILENSGFELDIYNDTFDEEIFTDKLSTSHGLIIGSHNLTHGSLKNAKLLRIVVKHGSGLDNIDLNFMESKGIAVENITSVNANAVADLTFGLILDVSRKISTAREQVKDGIWKPIIGGDVHKKNLSILGFGEIGQKVAKRALGFDMNIRAYDPFLDNIPSKFKDFVSLASLDDAIKYADFLSIHVPLTKSTLKLIDKDQFRMMKKSAIIINTSRGSVINEIEMYNFLKENKIKGAGLDVLSTEPVDMDNGLLHLENVTILPHIGMYTKETLNSISMLAANKMVNYFSKE